jgi:uncharacterized protein (TIGR00369 family)
MTGLPTSGTLPWTKGCFVCGQDNPRGLKLRSRLADGDVVLDYTTVESDLGWADIIHGGLAATLLDEVMTWSAMLAARGPCVTAEWTVRLVAPIRVGQKLICRSSVPASGKRLIKTAGTIIDETGEMLASATGKYLRMPGEDTEKLRQDFVVGDDCIEPGEIFDF